MCVAAAPLLLAATAVSSISQIAGGFMQAGQARYAAQIADMNAKTAAGQANDSELNTQLEAQRRYRMLAQTKGSQEAAMAANGIDLGFGTALDIQRDTAMIGAEDVAQIYKAGSERTKGFDTESWNYRSEAAAQRSKASGAIVSGFMSAASTALGGASQMAKMKSGQSFGG